VGRRTYQRDPFRDVPTTAVTVVEQSAVDLHYDYSSVAEVYREAVRRSALVIKPRLKRAAEDIFVIGKELTATKSMLPHGQYTRWLDIEFGLSERMAQRFVNVYARLGAKTDIMSVLPPTTLYLLAAPSTPDEAIQAVEQQLDRGERISVATVQRLINDAKQQVQSQVVDPFPAGEASGAPPLVNGADPARSQAAQRLATALANVIELLSGQPAEDWALLFRTDELRRLCNELIRLRSTLPGV
jgi:hypothetical protein